METELQENMDNSSLKAKREKLFSEAFVRCRRLARVIAMQYLFQVDINDAWNEEKWTERGNFLTLFETAMEENDQEEEMEEAPSYSDIEIAWGYAEELINGVFQSRAQIDEMIVSTAMNWKLNRMGRVDRAILRLCTYELLKGGKVKPAIAIDEAVNLAKVFGQPDSSKFVNGVLDKIKGLVLNEKAGQQEGKEE